MCAILHVFSCPVSVLRPRYYTGHMAIKALFFDVGNTLLFPNRNQMLARLHQRQIFPSTELLQKIERQTKREFDSLAESNSTVDHGFWHIYYSHLLDELGIPDEAVCSAAWKSRPQNLSTPATSIPWTTWVPPASECSLCSSTL